MSAAANFIAEAQDTYIAANAAALRWMLARPPINDVFLNTKINSLTLSDYGPGDGVRGPGYTYGWIQGRGLEALATHAAFFSAIDPALAGALDSRGRSLYGALKSLQADDGHAYFCYDAAMQPVGFDPAGRPVPQARPPEIFTYSDAFVAKGLVAASARYAPAELPRYLDYLQVVIDAIPAGCFQSDERSRLSVEAAAAQAADYGPRMILLGAAGLLRRIGRGDRAQYAEAFIAYVLERHCDPASGLLVDVPGQDAVNVGHAIEFAGFALEHYGDAVPPALVRRLEQILIASFEPGFVEPGIALTVSLKTRTASSAYCPWWSLPEAIRAAALCYARTKSAASLGIWQRAHKAFFERYWRGSPPIAYQTMTRAGPVDFVPATPDLDPGYHTGLSLLAAIESTTLDD